MNKSIEAHALEIIGILAIAVVGSAWAIAWAMHGKSDFECDLEELRERNRK